MREELLSIQSAIEQRQLPRTLQDLFREIYEPATAEFVVQESVVHDYKADTPTEFARGYGAGIIRLALAFYNTFGGVIVFGVDDRSRRVRGRSLPLDIEALNRALSDFSGHVIECTCQLYSGLGEERTNSILVVLVPRRVDPVPARLTQQLDRYEEGTVFVRQRHEALSAVSTHYPLLFSSRTHDGTAPGKAPSIQKSVPAPMASMKSFIGRNELLVDLWTWLVSGRDPRRYLYGPGGSGKSTLAYEFAESITNEYGGIVLPNGEVIDYVLFLSAKETEFNVSTAKEQPFVLRDFENSEQQFAKILYHSGAVSQAELDNADPLRYREMLGELVDCYNGLIVLDDIDALSRASRDTGEEDLFIAAVRARKITRVLYTLRSPPSNALNSSVNVPGLEFETEYCPFIEAYSAQIAAAPPSPKELVEVFQETNGIPLLIELVVGLRRHFKNYGQVIEKLREIDGDAIRGYLYRREYDRIRSDRTRLMLSLLSMIDGPLDANSMEKLLGTTSEKLRDSIAETSGIFVLPVETRDGGVHYELVDAAKPFITAKNSEIRFVAQLERKVHHFSQGQAATSPAERLLIVKLHELVRGHKWDEVRVIGDDLAADDVRLGNPQIRSYLGQGYAAAGGAAAERAREHFKAAEGLGAKDAHMMRSWYHLECNSGSRYLEARKICRKVVEDKTFGRKTRSEFLAKMASTFYSQGREIGSSNPAKAQSNMIKSIVSLNQAVWLGRGERGFDINHTLGWVDRSLGVFFRHLLVAPEDGYRLVKELIESKTDLDPEVRNLTSYYIGSLTTAYRNVRKRDLFGTIQRYGAEIPRMPKAAERYPNTMRVFDELHRKLIEVHHDLPDDRFDDIFLAAG